MTVCVIELPTWSGASYHGRSAAATRSSRPALLGTGNGGLRIEEASITRGPAHGERGHRVPLRGRIRSLLKAIEDNDDAKIERAILRFSRSRRAFAPLGFVVGAFALLFSGLRLLVSNWRLTLVQVLPAVWIWLAMYDLKAHVLHGKSFNVVRGPILIPIGLVFLAITIASFFLNAVFAMAIARPGRPEIRPALAQARRHLAQIIISGTVVGSALAFSATVAPRWHRPWFALSLGIVIGVMMVSYVALPARLIGVKPEQSPRDKLTTSVLGGILGATVCTPPYMLGRVGILMLGSKCCSYRGSSSSSSE